jgi:hypothetical protein
MVRVRKGCCRTGSKVMDVLSCITSLTYRSFDLLSSSIPSGLVPKLRADTPTVQYRYIALRDFTVVRAARRASKRRADAERAVRFRY